MSVRIMRAEMKNSALVARTMAARNPARGLKARAPNAHVATTSSVAKRAQGARPANSFSPNTRKEDMQSQYRKIGFSNWGRSKIRGVAQSWARSISREDWA